MRGCANTQRFRRSRRRVESAAAVAQQSLGPVYGNQPRRRWRGVGWLAIVCRAVVFGMWWGKKDFESDPNEKRVCGV
jgi:ferric-dicitrate binding protein FerR (iron transport regulator)